MPDKPRSLVVIDDPFAGELTADQKERLRSLLLEVVELLPAGSVHIWDRRGYAPYGAYKTVAPYDGLQTLGHGAEPWQPWEPKIQRQALEAALPESPFTEATVKLVWKVHHMLDFVDPITKDGSDSDDRVILCSCGERAGGLSLYRHHIEKSISKITGLFDDVTR